MGMLDGRTAGVPYTSIGRLGAILEGRFIHMIALSDNLWLFTYPQRRLGVDLRRNVTVIRLSSGRLVIHSTGPFSPGDVGIIQGLGTPGWLVEAMLQHDTYAKEGREAFPDVPFLAPMGFSEHVGFLTYPLIPPPPEWGTELEVLRVDGVENYEEHVCYHRESRTLIVADLVFNFGPDEPMWTELMLKAAVGSEHNPGMSRPFKYSIKDKDAFMKSMECMMDWDFDRVIVGHGDVLETAGKAKVSSMLRNAGY